MIDCVQVYSGLWTLVIKVLLLFVVRWDLYTENGVGEREGNNELRKETTASPTSGMWFIDFKWLSQIFRDLQKLLYSLADLALCSFLILREYYHSVWDYCAFKGVKSFWSDKIICLFDLMMFIDYLLCKYWTSYNEDGNLMDAFQMLEKKVKNMVGTIIKLSIELVNELVTLDCSDLE